MLTLVFPPCEAVSRNTVSGGGSAVHDMAGISATAADSVATHRPARRGEALAALAVDAHRVHTPRAARRDAEANEATTVRPTQCEMQPTQQRQNEWIGGLGNSL